MKLDIFGVFIDVLKQTTLVSRGSRNTEEGVLLQLKANVRICLHSLHNVYSHDSDVLPLPCADSRCDV